MKKEIRYRTWVIAWFFLIQGLIWLFIQWRNASILESSGWSREKQLRQASDYISLSTISWSTYWPDAAKLKLWDFSNLTGIYNNSWWSQPEWRTDIAKAWFMYGKKDFESVHQILANIKVKDTRIISLVLGLRSWVFCKQRMQVECSILARDSVILDPFSPLWYLLMGQSYRSTRQFQEAKKSFEQYEILSWTITPEYLLYRGINYFYTRDRDLSKKDLMRITGDPLYGFEATIFLGRNELDNKNYTGAMKIFSRAMEKNSTGSILPYLWLARTERKQKDFNSAMQLYESGYVLFPNNIELITDMMQLASLQKNQILVNDLKNAITMSLGSSVYNHELAGRRYREIGETEESEKVIRLGITYLSGNSDTIGFQEQKRNIYTQLHHTLIQHIFDRFVFKGDNTNTRYAELDSINSNESQLLFTKMLQNKLFKHNNPVQASIWFTWRILTEKEFVFAKARYNILSNDFLSANITIASIKTGAGDDIKINRLKAALQMQQGNLTEAYKYINTIRSAGYLAKLPEGELETEFWLWQQAMKPFKPWIDWLLPYLDPDKLLD